METSFLLTMLESKEGNKTLTAEPERKRLKGALGSVAIYGSSDEDDEDGGSGSLAKGRQLRHNHKNKTFNLYSGKPSSYASSLGSHNQHMYGSNRLNMTKGPPHNAGMYSAGNHHHGRQSMPFWMAPN